MSPMKNFVENEKRRRIETLWQMCLDIKPKASFECIIHFIIYKCVKPTWKESLSFKFRMTEMLLFGKNSLLS